MIDLTKPVQTRDGREVRLYNADKLDGGAGYALHGAILDSLGWQEASWTKDGSFCVGEKNCRDLVNIPVKRSGRINVYSDSGYPGCLGCFVHETEGEAKQRGGNGAAQVYIEREE